MILYIGVHHLSIARLCKVTSLLVMYQTYVNIIERRIWTWCKFHDFRGTIFSTIKSILIGLNHYIKQFFRGNVLNRVKVILLCSMK